VGLTIQQASKEIGSGWTQYGCKTPRKADRAGIFIILKSKPR